MASSHAPRPEIRLGPGSLPARPLGAAPSPCVTAIHMIMTTFQRQQESISQAVLSFQSIATVLSPHQRSQPSLFGNFISTFHLPALGWGVLPGAAAELRAVSHGRARGLV